MSKFTGNIIAAFAGAMVILLVVISSGLGQTINLSVNGEKATISSDNMIGALGDPNPTNLDTDEWTAVNDLLVDDLEVNDDAFVLGDLDVTGSISGLEKTTVIAQATDTSDVTLTSSDSGTTYLLSATGTNIILPAVSSTGANFKFRVNGNLDTINMIVKSAEGDNIEGTLLVAGAVVDCAAEDQINFVVDGENIGDYFEIMSDGTQWLLGDSGVLTAAKLTCTDPA